MSQQFFDINKLPKDFGILVFPISISRTEHHTGQTPEDCLNWLKHFSPKKVSEPKIGANIIYGDSLYMNSKEPAFNLKDKFTKIIIRHKNTLSKIIKKHRLDFQIQHAFSYEVWNQLFLDYDGDFDSDFSKFKKIYNQDKLFQKYVQDDAVFCKRELDAHQLNFFVEEFLLFSFLSKKKIRLPNEYIQGREKWVLWCYPGVPLKGMIYTYQKNFFKLEAPENPYQNHTYDLESKKLIDYTKIDLEKYNYKY